jgi:hypothetical protein
MGCSGFLSAATDSDLSCLTSGARSGSCYNQSYVTFGCDPQMYDHNETLLNIDCMNIYAFDAQLYQQLVMYPAEVLVLLDKEAKQVICEIARQDDLDFTVEVTLPLAHRIPELACSEAEHTPIRKHPSRLPCALFWEQCAFSRTCFQVLKMARRPSRLGCH